MTEQIKIGYEVETGKEIKINPSHLIVTGVTQMSGKTTTLEALIKRSKLKAIVFKTKIGEKSFTEGVIIPPYFKDEFDWEEASNLLEASRKEKLKFERSWIIKYSKGANSLLEFKKNIDEALISDKIRSLDRSVLTALQAYLEKILPELQYAPLSRTLDLQEGINIMDLERFREETQGIIIKSVMSIILKEYKNTIVVLPEAWTFLPQKRGSPCKIIVEKFIRQGATNNNYLWIDSQDITQIDKTPLKQVSTWVLGLQTELNEIKRTLDQVPLSKSLKPKPENIATLKKGHFIVCTPRFTKRVYVQPSWLDDEKAIQIAQGELDVESIDKPKQIGTVTLLPSKIEPMQQVTGESFQKYQQELVELRHDFFTKLSQIQENINSLSQEIINIRMIKPKQEINTDELISKVLQKIPLNNYSTVVNKEEIINEIISRIPRGQGAVTYEVMPLEKIKKDFLEEAKNKIISDIQSLSNNAKKVLKYLEVRGVGLSVNEIAMKGLLYPSGAGGYSKIVNDAIKELQEKLVGEKQTNGRCFGRLKRRIESILSDKEAKPEEIEQVYSHILMEILK